MLDLYNTLLAAGEPYAAGFFRFPEGGRFLRYCCAHSTFLQHVILPAYNGKRLYPCGYKLPVCPAVSPCFSFTFSADIARLQKISPEAAQVFTDECCLLPWISPPHNVGGGGFVHSIPNFPRLLSEGLDGFRSRVEMLPECEFRQGLLILLDGINIYRLRCVALLRESDADDALISAMEHVMQTPRNIYEAFVAFSFIYYLDMCDNPGRLDHSLLPFWDGSDVTSLYEELFDNIDANNGWTTALGPDCNGLTLQCLHAIRGKRRPTIELRVDENTPDEIWKAAEESLMTGCGQPAFYNEKLYQEGLHKAFPQIPKEDLLRFNGGGCTETMLEGISNVGSIDAGINTSLVFSDTLRSCLKDCKTFNEFVSAYMHRLEDVCNHVIGELYAFHSARAKYRPNPMRSLLIDDCIERCTDYNAGGARYSWSITNFAGMVNVFDSLLAVRTMVYEKGMSADEFINALDAGEKFVAPCFGVDDENADSFCAGIADRIFGFLEGHTPFLGGKYLPASIQFVTYADAGKAVPATPDGRCCGAPLCDSVGAVHGKDIKGPTALLKSVARIPYSKALGTPVLNLRMRKDHLEKALRPLITGFFSIGGMQAQITCVSTDDMKDALIHPELHENLIVRIGGYSEYFNRLSPELKQTVIERTEQLLQ